MIPALKNEELWFSYFDLIDNISIWSLKKVPWVTNNKPIFLWKENMKANIVF